ncbi:MAG: RES domain-containing protein [Balneolaceae bacterium]|nr:MAG: RES domain-containing protein [Balneolaceae bacterium]
MEAYRLTREKYSHSLSGRGAALKGARWNSPGIELIYTASNRSLAMAEVAVHFTLATLPADYMMMTLFIPDSIKLRKLTIQDLPPNWNDFPHPAATQVIGDRFVADNEYAVLQIPSVVTYGDFNLLINPYHPDFSGIKIADVVKFPFDRRIFR